MEVIIEFIQCIAAIIPCLLAVLAFFGVTHIRQIQIRLPQLLEKPGKPLVFSAPRSGLGMKGQNLSFIISSMGLFFKKNPIER